MGKSWLNKWLPKGYSWRMQYTNKKNRKRRSIGGIAVKTKARIEKRGDERENKEDGLMEINVKLGNE